MLRKLRGTGRLSENCEEIESEIDNCEGERE
jgi:hypothetical protein